MAKLEAHKLEPNDYPQWDQFVEKVPEGRIFHTTRWLRKVADDLQVWVVVDSQAEIVGGVAVPIKKQGLLPRSPIPPFTPYVGPLVWYPDELSNESRLKLIREVTERLLLYLAPVKLLDFNIPIGEADLTVYNDAGFSIKIHHTHILPDNKTYQVNIATRKRSQIRQLRKLSDSGIIHIEKGFPVEKILPVMHPIYHQYSISFYQRLFSVSERKTSWESYTLIDEQGGILNALLIVYDRKWSYNLMPGHNLKLKGQGVLYHSSLLLIDEALQETFSAGRKFDFEGSSIPSIAAFYRHLGGIPYPIARVSRYHSLKLTLAKEIRDYFVRRKREMEFYRNFRI